MRVVSLSDCSTESNSTEHSMPARNRLPGLLGESPLSPAHRWLRDESLDIDDWIAIWTAYRAFIVQVRLIVDRARNRQKEI
jgi:hypothetical protein